MSPITTRIINTMFPPARRRSSDTENKEDAAVGAIDLIADAKACDIPPVAPREARFGALSKMIIWPAARQSLLRILLEIR